MKRLFVEISVPFEVTKMFSWSLLGNINKFIHNVFYTYLGIDIFYNDVNWMLVLLSSSKNLHLVSDVDHVIIYI